MIDNVFVQALGILGAILDVYASSRKNDRDLKQAASWASIAFSFHYFLLGGFSGALSELFNAIRTSLSSVGKTKLLGAFFISIYIISIFSLSDTLIDALPFIAGAVITVGLYFFKDIGLRFCYLIGWVLWLTYSVSVGSLGGILTFVILCITTTLNIFNFIYKEKTEV